jgi:tetratricopeptide (TPR) repeat protein
MLPQVPCFPGGERLSFQPTVIYSGGDDYPGGIPALMPSSSWKYRYRYKIISFMMLCVDYFLMGKKRGKKKSSFPRVPPLDPAVLTRIRTSASLFDDILNDLDNGDMPDQDDDQDLRSRVLAVLSESPGEETEMEQAMELCREALENTGEEKQDLARRATEVCPDCTEAWLILAEECRKEDPEASLGLYHHGVRAAEQAILHALFRECSQNITIIPNCRDYLEARFGLACAYAASGRKEEALSHMEAVLMLDPRDGIGVRYPCISLLIERSRDKRAWDLLSAYNGDIFADHAYHRALLTFRKSGAGPEARSALMDAMKKNRHVVRFLTGDEKVPSHFPDVYRPGDRTEAGQYVKGSAGAWRATPGALEWLKDQTTNR